MTYIALILSVLIGLSIVYGLKPGQHIAKLLLSFSGAYLLSVTVLHLIPEVFSVTDTGLGYYILLGLFVQLILDFFSKGAEHGHIHIQKDMSFPWALFISLCLHAFMEGIPLGNVHQHEQLLWAVVIHKVPIAVLLGTFFVNSNVPKLKATVFLVAFSLMSPLGALAGEYSSFFMNYNAEITAVVVGVFLHISTIILFETSKDHTFNLLKFAAILVGMITAILV